MPNKKTAKPVTENSTDPLNINARLYAQIGRLLDDLESADRDDIMTMPQRIQSLIAVGRILTIFASLKKSDFNYGTSGSAVRKYSQVFQTPHGASVRAANSRPAEPFDLDRWSGDADDA